MNKKLELEVCEITRLQCEFQVIGSEASGLNILIIQCNRTTIASEGHKVYTI